MKYIIRERQYKKILKEENIGFEDILTIVNDSTPKFIPNDLEYYGLDKELFYNFKRKFSLFREYLARVIYNFKTNEYGFLGSFPKPHFIRTVIIYALLDFFYEQFGKEFDVEDFMRDGEQDGFFYLFQDIYGKMIGDMYDEFKED